ncbi:hypothetical protein [Sphingomonas sp. AX6]|uniref:hypothetical protein n=1 Tax=Sphingomonas sp. AX6 TaxID=2653171 RepID=UPI0012F3ED2F|nr:hypothetical protein [Sphingomonas sp. AX6]VXC63734.1 conserved hypothetical protein [Sphingomonas sp. AX6]
MLTLQWRKPAPRLALRWRGPDRKTLIATPPGQLPAVAAIIGPQAEANVSGANWSAREW